MNGFDSIKNRASDQLNKPKSITRKEAEALCRSIISKHAGEKMPENLFKDSVDQLMEEINGSDYSDEDMDSYDF